MPGPPTASIVIPTRGRPDYLEVTLASVVPQAAAVGAEVVVVTDGDQPPSAVVARRWSSRLVSLPNARGANAARNAGARAARGELLVFVDDDVRAPAGWLQAILSGATQAPDHAVFGGPIRAALEGGGPRACGREAAPITTLDLGPADGDVALVWSANMAIRRCALDDIGGFDETLRGCGEEEDWLRRYTARGGRVRYLAAACLDHRRTRADSRLSSLARAAYARGAAARRYDIHRACAPPLPSELRVLAGCAWHLVRRRCLNGLVLGAHATGRVREALAERRA